MVNVKIICSTGISSSLMTKELEKKAGSNYKFSTIQYEKIADAASSTDVFVLSSAYGHKVEDVQRIVGNNSKVICLDNYEYSILNLDGIVNKIYAAA